MLFTARPSREIIVRPGESIQAAVDQMTPGTAVVVKPGGYRENVRFNKRDGSADAPYWLVSEEPGTAEIVAADNSKSALVGSGARFFMFGGFRVIGGAQGIQLTQSSGNPCEDFHIAHNHVSFTSGDTIKLSQVLRGHVTDNTCTRPGNVNGQPSRRLAEGIDIVAGIDMEVSWNRVHDILPEGLSSGAGAISAKCGSTDVRYEGNWLHDVCWDGLNFGGYGTGPVGDPDSTRVWLTPYGFPPDRYMARHHIAIHNKIERVGKRGMNMLGALDCIARENLLIGAGYPYAVFSDWAVLYLPDGDIRLPSLRNLIEANVFAEFGALYGQSGARSGVEHQADLRGNIDAAAVAGWAHPVGPREWKGWWGEALPEPEPEPEPKPEPEPEPKPGPEPGTLEQRVASLQSLYAAIVQELAGMQATSAQHAARCAALETADQDHYRRLDDMEVVLRRVRDALS